MRDWAGILRECIVRPSPREIVRVNVAVTYRCDSRCLMCGTWRHPSRPSDELSPDEIVSGVAARGLCSQLRTIHITGGEPLLRDDLPVLVSRLAAAFPRSRFDLATNAMSLPRLKNLTDRMDRGGLLGRMHLIISVDGRQPVHERLRGVKGSFRNVMESLCVLRNRWPTLPVSLSFTLTPLNKDELWHVQRIAEGFKVGFTARFATAGTFYHNKGRSIRWSPSDLQEAACQMEELSRQAAGSALPVVGRLALGPAFLMGAAAYARKPSRLFTCYAGIHSFLLDPAGNVYPCLALPERMGNIRQERFEDIWFGAKASAVRRSVAAERCHCWSECDVLPSLRRSRPSALMVGRLRSANRDSSCPSTALRAGGCVHGRRSGP